MLPIPKHLSQLLKPIGNNNNEFSVTGKITCSCGSEKFTIGIVGDDGDYEVDKVIRMAETGDHVFLVVKVKCNDCNQEHLIFDNDYHGWNGYVCGGDCRQAERPTAKKWPCNQCKETNHAMIVSIRSEGQADFIEQAGDDFDKKDWTEGFSWITIKTTCNTCGESNDEWMSYETM